MEDLIKKKWILENWNDKTQTQSTKIKNCEILKESFVFWPLLFYVFWEQRKKLMVIVACEKR